MATETKIVWALQQFFIGQWDDWEVVEDNEQLARSKYATFKATHYRDTRLIKRVEEVIQKQTVAEQRHEAYYGGRDY